ncbi:MAG: hypothetical protein LQ351_001835 [Letrouitia transgressa]|nr:MAG: hypothetical protein LQ351_001835 [Letrouitia transgressa]
MWILDWGMRLYELRRELPGSIKALGRGWYCITVRLPRARLTGCSCRSPLAHFYIHHAGSSVRELHPFTTITHLATENAGTDPSDDDFPIQFLFRKQGKLTTDPKLDEVTTPKSLLRRILRSKGQRITSVQWTAKLADLAEQPSSNASLSFGVCNSNAGREHTPAACSDSIKISLRLEGPYFYPADPYRYDTVICMVAGTGISGALAIVSAFTYHSSAIEQVVPASDTTYQSSKSCQPRRWRRCIVVWSVKEREEIAVPITFSCEGLEMRKFLTGGGRDRVDLRRELEEAAQDTEKTEMTEKENRIWVYISGPRAFVAAGKDACKAVQRKRKRLDFYAASWDP